MAMTNVLASRRRWRAAAAPAVLALACAPALSGVALAQEDDTFTGLDITDERTTPVDSATALDGAPADIRISSDGSIVFDAEGDPRDPSFDGFSAVTLNSSNGFTNEGTIAITDVLPGAGGEPVAAIRAQTDQINGPSFIVNDGIIEVVETYTREDDGVSGVDLNGDDVVDANDVDPDDVDDGDVDGPFAEGSGRFGILIEGASPFQGDLTTTDTSSITVEGNQSAGIRSTTQIDGRVQISGNMSLLGSDTVGLDLQGGVTGDLSTRGNIRAVGENARGVRIAGDVEGSFQQGASIEVRGFESARATNYIDPDFLSDDDEGLSLDADALLSGGPAVEVSASIQGGFLNDGLVGRGTVDDDETDENGEALDDVDNLSGEFNGSRSNGAITAIGDAPAVLIQPLNAGTPVDANDPDSPTAGSADIIIGGFDIEVLRDAPDADEDSVTDELRAIVAAQGVSDAEILAVAAANGVVAADLAELESLDVTVVRIADEDVYSFVNRGAISGDGRNQGFTATGLEIRGSEDGSRNTILAEGISNTGTISANAFEPGVKAPGQEDRADAVAIRIGSGAEVARLDNTNTISATVSAQSDLSPDARAVAILVEAGGQLNRFTNEGVVTVGLRGDHADGIAVQDQSGTLTEVINRGVIVVSYLDDFEDTDGDDETNNEDERTGDAVAVDLSANDAGVTVTQELRQVYQRDENGDVVLDDAGEPVLLTDPIDGFTTVVDVNDDGVIDENDVGDPAIIGDVRFGDGADTFNILAGSVTGDVSFGAGADVFRIDGSGNFGDDDIPSFRGDVDPGDGNLQLIIGEAVVAVTNDNAALLSSLEVGDGAELRVVIDSDDTVVDPSDDGTLAEFVVSGTVEIAADATITPEFIGLAQTQAGVEATRIVIDATDVQVAALETLLSEDRSFLYNQRLDAQIDPETGREQLVLTFSVRTPDELGLTTNEAAIFDSVLAAAATDDDVGTAIVNLNEAEFDVIYGGLLPDFGLGSTELILASIDGAVGAVANRLDTLHKGDRDGDGAVWAQEFVFYSDLEGGPLGPGFRAQGFGFAQGVDFPVGPLYALGANWGFSSGEFNEKGDDAATTVTSLQAALYGGAALGPLRFDLHGGFAHYDFESRRILDRNDVTDALQDLEPTAEWSAQALDASARLSAPFRLGRLYISPTVSASVLTVNEDERIETGGGPFNAQIDSRSYDYATVSTMLSSGWRFATARGSWWSPRLRVGYRWDNDPDLTQTGVFVDDSGQPITSVDELGNTVALEEFVLTPAFLPEAGFVFGFSLAAGSQYSSFSFDVDADYRDGYERTIGRLTFRFLF